jgi:hypothetical protein
MVHDFLKRNPVKMMVSQKSRNNRIKKINDKEKTLLALILMNHGEIPSTRLKRIFLEKNTFWDLETSKANLTDLGLLRTKEDTDSSQSIYFITKDHRGQLKDLISVSETGLSAYYEPHVDNRTCCEEYSFFWYLMQVDLQTNPSAFGERTIKTSGRSLSKVQGILQLDEKDTRYIIKVLNGLLSAKLFKKNVINKWVDILKTPHELFKKIYTMEYYDLRESGVLGREEVGKDNIDFLLEELEALKVGRWYPLDDFISSAKRTLFAANQPFRWIHFEERSIWRILDREFRILGLVRTSENNGSRYFSLTHLGAYCLEKISDEEFQDIIGRRKGKFIVHPNFEITLISREHHPRVLLELSMFTDSVVMDTMSVFKMSRESIQRGMRYGLTQDRMVGFLNEHNRTEIPQNVEYSVLDWGI